jgi:RNA polymerase sigma-70 factor
MGDARALVGAFIAQLGRAVDDAARLDDLLAQKLTNAARAWPTVTLAAEEFARALAERINSDEDPFAALAQLREADIYLAAATTVDAAGAFAAFESALLARVPAYLSRISASPAIIDEVKQALRVKLFVAGEGRTPRIRQYSGRGALDSWICAAAIRTARDLHRADQRRHDHGDDDLDVLAATDDPELEALRTRYRAEFRIALRESIAALEPRQRTLLRLHFFERLTTVELARLYGVNQSTASRWLATARDTVLQGVRERLRDKLGVSTSEFDSLVALLHSRLDISFSVLLRGSTA